MRVDCVTGSYTMAGGRLNGSDGICRVTFDTENPGAAEIRQAGRARNPSYLCPENDGTSFWAVEELPAEDAPKLLLFNPDRGADPGQSWPLDGTDACHVARHSHLVAVAQYGSGTVALIDTGGGNSGLITLNGQGPDPVRQASSHAHQVVFLDDGKRLVVTDLGGDTLCFYDLSGGAGSELSQVLGLPPGSGPRHLAVSGDESTIFVACELDDTVHILTRNGDKYETGPVVLLGERVGEQARGTDGTLSAIRLSPDGRHLYVAMRKQNMIASLIFDKDRQILTPQEYLPTGGIWPRDIALTEQGDHLLIANQHSGSLTIMARDSVSGRLTLLPEEITLPGVSCIIFPALAGL